MPEELRARWIELGEEIFMIGKKYGRETVARAMLKVAGEYPDVVDQKVVKNGKVGKLIGVVHGMPPKKEKKPLHSIAMTQEEVDKFAGLKERRVDRGQLETFLRVTNTKYTEEEIDALKGGEYVGVYNEKLLVFKK